MADPLQAAVTQYCGGGKKAEAAEEQLTEALGQGEERAALMLLDQVVSGTAAARGRALRLLHTGWWPTAPASAATRAIDVVLAAAADFEPDSPEWEDGAALLGNVFRSEPSQLTRLDTALAEASPRVRRVAATASGRIGFGAAKLVPRLGALLADPDLTVGDAALESLSALAPLAPLDGLPPLLQELRRAEGMRRYLTLAAVRAILEAHAHGDPLPAESLAGVQVAVAPALADPEPAIRQQAVAVLGAAGGDVEAAVTPFLADPSASVAATAAVALAKIGPPPAEALTLLRELLSAPDPERHHSALSAIEGAEAATLERLRPTLEPLAELPHLGDSVLALLRGGA